MCVDAVTPQWLSFYDFVEFPRPLAPERAVADWILANLVLLLAVWNYLG
jgi:hypothetical protein